MTGTPFWWKVNSTCCATYWVYKTTFKLVPQNIKGKGLENTREADLIVMKLRLDVSSHLSDVYISLHFTSQNMYKEAQKIFRWRWALLRSPFRVFLATKGLKIPQPWRKTVQFSKHLLCKCVLNLKALYTFWGIKWRIITLTHFWLQRCWEWHDFDEYLTWCVAQPPICIYQVSNPYLKHSRIKSGKLFSGYQLY